MNLAELIQTRRDGRSYAELSRSADGVPSPQRWQQLVALEPKTFPEQPAIRGIARALNVTERTVVLAAATSLGIEMNITDPLLIMGMPDGIRDLTTADCGVVWAVTAALIAARRAVTGSPDRP